VSESTYVDEGGALRRTSYSEGYAMGRVTLESRFWKLNHGKELLP